MRCTEDDLRAAAAAGLIEHGKIAPLLAFLAARDGSPRHDGAAAKPRVDAAPMLWYAGALLVIGAMGLFSTLAYSRMGGWALAATAIGYGAAFLASGHWFWRRRAMRTLGGLLVTVAVSMAPLAAFGVQDALDLWGRGGDPGAYRDFFAWVRASWLPMELAAIAAGLAAFWAYRFSFILMVVAAALWFLSMDVAAWLMEGRTRHFDFGLYRVVSLGFGAALLVATWLADMARGRGDLTFWLHLSGLIAFWGALAASFAMGVMAWPLYGVANVLLLAVAALFGRRSYAVFGTLGLYHLLGDLSARVFQDSLLFPFALSLIGVTIIALGWLYHRKETAIAARLARALPTPLRRLHRAGTG